MNDLLLYKIYQKGLCNAKAEIIENEKFQTLP